MARDKGIPLTPEQQRDKGLAAWHKARYEATQAANARRKPLPPGGSVSKGSGGRNALERVMAKIHPLGAAREKIISALEKK